MNFFSQTTFFPSFKYSNHNTNLINMEAYKFKDNLFNKMRLYSTADEYYVDKIPEIPKKYIEFNFSRSPGILTKKKQMKTKL